MHGRNDNLRVGHRPAGSKASKIEEPPRLFFLLQAWLIHVSLRLLLLRPDTPPQSMASPPIYD